MVLVLLVQEEAQAQEVMAEVALATMVVAEEVREFTVKALTEAEVATEVLVATVVVEDLVAEEEKLLEHLVIHLQETVVLMAEAAEELMMALLVEMTLVLEMVLVAL
jgi:hypothetical protein